MSEPSAETPPASPQLYCGNCGAPIPPGKHFCDVCLAPASLAVTTPPAKEEAKAETKPPAAAEPAALALPMTPPPEPVVPVAPGVPSVVEPAAPARVEPVVPVVPAGPEPASRPGAALPMQLPPVGPPPPPPVASRMRWPWLMILVITVSLALPLLLMGCIILFSAGNMATTGDMSADEYRRAGLLCCLLPGLLLGGGAILAGAQALRHR